MDIDISDILADVSSTSALSRSATDAAAAASYHALSSTALSDHQQLVRAWTNERGAPDLLPYPTELMARMMERVRLQIQKIEDLTASGAGYHHHHDDNDDNNMSNSVYDNNSKNNNNSITNRYHHHHQQRQQQPPVNLNLNLTLSILQTDLSRTQFLIRSLLRQRLAKLTKHAPFYLGALGQDRKQKLLSVAELQFLQAHQARLVGLYEGSFLAAFPNVAGLRRLDDGTAGAGGGGAGGEKMVDRPDGAAAVVVRCLSEEWSNGDHVLLGDGGGKGGDDDDDDDDEADGLGVELSMRRGQVWVVRWRDVKKGLIGGKLELL